MAKKPNRTTVPFNHRISRDIAEAFIQFCESRDDTIREHLEIAMRRHMASPPPKVEIPPLPPLVVKKPKS